MRSTLLLAFFLVACSSSDTDPADGSAGGTSSVAGAGGQGGTGSAGKASGGAGHGASAGQSSQGGASGQAGKGQGGSPQGGSAGKGQGGSPQGGAGSGQAGKGQAGSGQAGQGGGQGQAGSGTAGSGEAGQGQAGQGQAGSGEAGQGQAGSGQAGSGNAGGSTGDPFEANRVECVAKINEYRASIGLVPYERWTEGEACADQMADHDADVQIAHDGFGKAICSPRGNGQDECPGYGSPDALDGCLGQMWAEGPTANGEWDVAHGHYMNMVGDYTYMGYHQHFTRVACGFSSKGWFLQNFE